MGRDKKKQLYVVVSGRNPGIYDKWFGPGGAEEQVKEFQDAVYKGFYTLEQAREWLEQLGETQLLSDVVAKSLQEGDKAMGDEVDTLLNAGKVVIFTDGAVYVNPGQGGFGDILLHKRGRKELWGGFRETTNNRMELMACIEGLRALKSKSSVVVYSDSKYVVDGIVKGWAERWRANGWMRDAENKAENTDLWAVLLDLREQHDVEFRWVEGHTGHPENEYCDQLARRAAAQKDLPPDTGYEVGETEDYAL